ncbi:MAG: OsmC family protein [Leifsonia flava]
MTNDRIPTGVRVAPGSVSATRVGDRTFEGRNDRGSIVLIGPTSVDGAFTPGELLKAALAGCAGMSADSVIARRLGDDFTATYWAHGTSDEAENRYKAIDEEIVIDGLDEMSVEDRAKLINLIERSIEKSCTVARSVGSAIDLSTTINGTEV